MASATSATVLLLSSDPVNRAVMKEVLERAGYVVLATGDLGKAVDLLARTPVDLLITRPYVENIPGHEPARYLRTRNPRMGVIVLAGLLADDHLQYRADLEDFAIYPPPFPADQLLNKVAEVLKAAKERKAENRSTRVPSRLADCENARTDLSTSHKRRSDPGPRHSRLFQ